MRTTLILPEELIDAARKTLGFTSKTDTVVYALREVVRRGRRDDLKTLLGRVTPRSGSMRTAGRQAGSPAR